jgi:hypothetical protein
LQQDLYCVYVHENKYNGKKYFGITKRGVNVRWGKDGKGYGWSRKNLPYYSTHFANAIRKYGWDGFTHTVLYENLSKEEACNKECELIHTYHTNDCRFGYNQTLGGQCGSSGLQWFTDGKTNYYGNVCPENMYKGRTLCISDESRENLKTAKYRHWYNDGVTELYIKEGCDVPQGYVKGRIKRQCKSRNGVVHNKGKHRYTNGEIYVYDYECPPGFKLSIKEFNKRRRHLTNGTNHRFIYEDEVDKFLLENDGWYLFSKEQFDSLPIIS